MHYPDELIMILVLKIIRIQYCSSWSFLLFVYWKILWEKMRKYSLSINLIGKLAR